MDVNQIETDLKNPDFQYRIKAITALKDHTDEVAIPILTQHHDSEFLVRTFVARALGRRQTPESFATLIRMTRFDNTPNVRAEAANSLSLFGRVSAAQLVEIFFRDDHWLVRRSILAALADMDCPEELFEVCNIGIDGDDDNVHADAVGALSLLATTTLAEPGLAKLLSQKNTESAIVRIKVAQALKHFDQPQAKAALAELRLDEDHQVVGAAMEDLLP